MRKWTNENQKLCGRVLATWSSSMRDEFWRNKQKQNFHIFHNIGGEPFVPFNFHF